MSADALAGRARQHDEAVGKAGHRSLEVDDVGGGVRPQRGGQRQQREVVQPERRLLGGRRWRRRRRRAAAAVRLARCLRRRGGRRPAPAPAALPSGRWIQRRRCVVGTVPSGPPRCSAACRRSPWPGATAQLETRSAARRRTRPAPARRPALRPSAVSKTDVAGMAEHEEQRGVRTVPFDVERAGALRGRPAAEISRSMVMCEEVVAMGLSLGARPRHGHRARVTEKWRGNDGLTQALARVERPRRRSGAPRRHDAGSASVLDPVTPV